MAKKAMKIKQQSARNCTDSSCYHNDTSFNLLYEAIIELT